MKNKIFKDPVHGYIKIPTELIETFIDTELFQRLGSIEQTSMRCLYPAARHDRFIHSIGVFHLGRLAIEALFENTSDEILYKVFKKYKHGEQIDLAVVHKKDIRDMYKNEIDRIKNSFYVACLMHDCAHAPFSHTFEHFYYNFKEKEEEAKMEFIRKIDRELGTNLRSQSIYASPHEVVSSYVLVKWLSVKYRFTDKKGLKLKENIKDEHEPPNIDVELVVRCILGRYYFKRDGDYTRSFYNAVINLLNSKSIDVDKLDYLMRDTFNSGVDNFSIDVERFISSITILKHPEKSDDIVLGYKKNSLSILKSIIYARDHLYTWIYSHHKVVYQAEMLKRLIKNIDSKDNWKGFINSAFDVENFFKPKLFPINKSVIYFYMVSDNDMCYIFKMFYKLFDEYKCIFAREHHVSMWKSYAEYLNIFKHTPFKIEEQKKIVEKQSEKLYMKYKDDYNNYLYKEKDFFTVDSSYKEGYIHPNKTYIEINGVTKTISEVSDDFTFPRFAKEFFYLYLPKNINEKHKEELMEMIKRNI